MPLVEYTVRGKQYRKSLKYKQFIPASSGKIQKDVFSSDYVYGSDRSLDLKKYFPSAQV
ncbi:50S ribosomal protein L22 [Streptococcus sanguinis SK1 = NCTC 7863]|uniref:50S ribosomal protein L22 n=3 Tax=Streptococcus sanguinis TaxID=1305 RepID=F0IWD8_STRSA|nr:50S ribosomal protein L22 [Streptococcus sanguinis SK160]EGF09333.1 50S ribosomal protein L22 [Streptococcus sanguinis SK1 = NCTC 7863]EGF20020.1 50S ribosomal protein L22 [Streptococcus sanguinis SK408]EGF21961.1 50S ribosomal protein L22 [Streptococcus sanguinis SK1058]EGG40757.1 50S ribosomal protein L22 [Streptococcus sanguinis SK1087]